MNTIFKHAIYNSHKIELTLEDGKVLTVHPYFILRQRDNDRTLLRGFIEEDTESCNINVDQIRQTVELPQHYAIGDFCSNFSFAEYELIYPKRGDLNDPKH